MKDNKPEDNKIPNKCELRIDAYKNDKIKHTIVNISEDSSKTHDKSKFIQIFEMLVCKPKIDLNEEDY